MTLDELATRLHAKRAGRGYSARCPAHEDSSPSLSLNPARNGGIVLHCHAGCSPTDVCRALGLTLADLQPDGPDGHGPHENGGNGANGKPTIAATYDYTDAAGTLVFQTVRYQPKDFRQRQPDGRGGWVWNLTGCTPVLFRLPKVLAAVQTGETVYLTEGEKDALTLETYGLVATCNPMGAGKWREDYNATLAGAHVVILPDDDKPGRQHAEQVAHALQSIASTVRIAPPFPGAKDVTEWFARGGTVERLHLHLAPPPPPPPPFYYLTELFRRPELLEPPPIIVPRFAWEGRVTLFAAREKVGKSTLMGQAVAALASAPGEFFGDAIPAPCKTLWVGIDEPLGDIVRRLDRYDLNAPALAARVAVRNEKPTATDLVSWIRAEAFRLVILDHLTAYASGRVEDPNKAMQYHPIMQEFSLVARETGAALIVLHHSPKGTSGYRDSTAIGAGADVLIHMRGETDEAGEEKDGLIRIFTCKGRVPVVSRFQTEYRGGEQVLVPSDLPLDQQILRFIGANPNCSGRDIRGAVGGKTAGVLEALAELSRNGLIRDIGTGGKGRWLTTLSQNGSH